MHMHLCDRFFMVERNRVAVPKGDFPVGGRPVIREEHKDGEHAFHIHKSSGKSTRTANMLFTFIVTQTFLRMLRVMKFRSFIFLAFLVVMTLYCYYFMEETENIAIE
ncbi:hypothetical protein Sango_1516200 [Sesamum angolense]|uniref:Uncharacterized protein n=1 Tax=Sesamum angolense TaxID=2727404 RepID=A0AAE1WP02_9LAMI|nr:hypothetical protein Sango_1516200 [Sesamum angolense]